MSNLFLPTLRKIDSKGKIREWEVFVDDRDPQAVVLGTRAGLMGGKKVVKTITIRKGKNIGRANETTPKTQATAEAESLWKKKIREGYVDEQVQEGTLENFSVAGKPMLAHKFKERAHDLPEDVDYQPKLDGIRSYVKVRSSGVDFDSRGGKSYDLPQFIEPLQELVGNGDDLDGELYIPGQPLRKISSAVKKHGPLSQKLEFRIFDMPSDKPFEERFTELLERFNRVGIRALNSAKIYLVPTYRGKKADMHRYYQRFMSKGYEGIMIRDPRAPYAWGRRAACLQKYKEFQDDEFPIVDVVEDRTGHGKFLCMIPNGNTFEVRPMGSDAYRKYILQNPKEFIGAQLTVRYQVLLDSGIPQFGVGVAVRDYE